MNNDMFWENAIRYIITLLVYAFYIGLVFFTFSGNWEFLATFEYWGTTIMSTTFAFFLRFLWVDKGILTELEYNKDIKGKEQGKNELVSQVNQRNLTDDLDKLITKTNRENKLKAYKNKVEKKITKLKQRGFFRPFREKRLGYWQDKRTELSKENFNVDIVNVRYYKYDIDEMLSSFYKQSAEDRSVRHNKSTKILTSYRINVITFLGFAFFNGLIFYTKAFEVEDLLTLAGQVFIFTINIYNGFRLGKDFIKNDYSSNLSDDYVFLKGFLKNKVS